MRDKTVKLAGQFDDRYNGRSTIFANKTFWSTGRIEGIDFDIKQAITEHGGVYEQYGFRNVSHIIASNVALSNQNWKKLLGGRFASKSYCLVTPRWLEDSIAAGKALPESDYVPECIRVAGNLDSFLADTTGSASESPVQQRILSEPFSMHQPSNHDRQRVLRVDMPNPRDSESVTEHFCYEFLSAPYPVGRRGYLTVAHMGSVNLFSLDFSSHNVSLLDALTAELDAREWSGVAKVSLSMYPCEPGVRPLLIFPIANDLPPSARNARMHALVAALTQSCEDSVESAITDIVIEAGICANAILLDAVNSLIALRRLDSARDILRTLKKLANTSSDPNSRLWVESLLDKSQYAFRWTNHGLQLVV